MLIQRIILLTFLGCAFAVPTEKALTWKERLEAKKAEFQEKINQEFNEIQQQANEKKSAFDAEKQRLKSVVDQLYQDAEKEFQDKLNKVNEWKANNPAPFALEVEGEPSLYETIRAKYEAAKNTKKEKLNTEIDKLFPGFKESVDAYEAEEAAKKQARKEKFDTFKQSAQEKMNETRQKFEQFAAEANAKLKEDFELAKQEHEAKKERAKVVLGNVGEIIKNATGLLVTKIKEERKEEAAEKLAAAQWISDKIKNKTEEWKQKHPLAAARSLSDVSDFLNDASGASGWQTATTVLMIICFIITIGLLILIFKQIRSRTPYERLDGNVHPPVPHSLSQPGYNPNFGGPQQTFVPSREALRKQDYPQLF